MASWAYHCEADGFYCIAKIHYEADGFCFIVEKRWETVDLWGGYHIYFLKCFYNMQTDGCQIREPRHESWSQKYENRHPLPNDLRLLKPHNYCHFRGSRGRENPGDRGRHTPSSSHLGRDLG